MLEPQRTFRQSQASPRLCSAVVFVVLAGCSPSASGPSSGTSGGQSGSGGSGGAGGAAGSGGKAGSGGTRSGGSGGGEAGSGGTSSGGSGGGEAGSGGTSSGGSGGGEAGSGGAAGSGGSGGSGGGAGGSTVQCESGKTACYGACVDTQTDPKNCNTCGNVCASDECNAGVCKTVKVCFKKLAVTDPLLADFDGYDGTTDPTKWVWAFNAPSGSAKAGYAGLYAYSDDTGSPAVSIVGPGNNDSRYAGKLATSSPASKWGGALGMWMSCVDAKAYQGISFWVKGTAPTGTATLTLATEATSPPDKDDPAGGGTCTSGECKGASIDFPVSSTWAQVLVKWDALTPGTANGSTVTTSGGDIAGLTWQVGLKFTDGGDAGWLPVSASYDLAVDDVQFIGSTPCEGSERLCGTACTDTSKDAENCGTCGNVCDSARTCSGGKCVCATGYTECSGTCVDTQIDAQNCGGCGKNCTGPCSGGSCQESSCTANMPQKDKKTNKGDSIDLGKYWINNNWWGDASASGSQSIWDTCSSGNTIGWGTEWNWSGGNGVISYASAVLGWHYGWKMNNTGLPIQLSANKKITCAWTYRVQPGKIINVSYDLFAHTQANPGSNDDPSDEIMIWLYRAGGAQPIGSTVATVSMAGISWELHQGKNGYWNVYSYVRSSNADTGATLVISDFLKDLTANRGLSSSKYLSSIQSGTEVYQGSGRLDTDQYSCTIQ
jgi:hypothetical protein